ncbi:uncharacterized protein LOC136713818 [Amia ocellicauda]|uniref:uncharacterized protein LOC136713818 n=1 Tax=Amia ocellicauda TaxID=2972642 RepID=UPI003463BE75
MCGLLGVAASLAVCKIMFNLFTLPNISTPFNPVACCCKCLLMFTDLVQAVFLALLLLAEPGMLNLALPSDVIALRFLLFQSHAYGVVLLLATPLIAIEVACRLIQPLPLYDKPHPEDTKVGCTECSGEIRSRIIMEILMLFPGFLSCLMVWTVAVDIADQQWRLEEDQLLICLDLEGSLLLCLPSLLTVILQPLADSSLLRLALVLYLVFAASVYMIRARLAGQGAAPTDPQSDRERGDTGGCMQAFAHHIHHTMAPQPGHPTGAIANSLTPHTAQSAAIERATKKMLTLLLMHPSPNTTKRHYQCHCCSTKCHFENDFETVMQQKPSTHTDTPHMSTVYLATPDLDGPQANTPAPRGRVSLPAGVLKGLLCGITLYLFPPGLAVHTSLIWGVETLTTWGLRHILKTPKEPRGRA